MAGHALSLEVEWSDGAGRMAREHSARLDDAHVVGLVAATLEVAGVPSGVVDAGVAFVDPAEIAGHNREHRGVDEATDVLAFPIDGAEAVPAGVPRQLGDVLCCPARVVDQVAAGTTMMAAGPGQEQGDGDVRSALERCVVHGTLHLVGHDHELGDAEAAAMFALEQRVLDAVRSLPPGEGADPGAGPGATDGAE